jgi:four helix bundle protein
MGSLSELETQLELAMLLKIVSTAKTRNGSLLCQEIGKMLHGLANAIKRR